MPSVLILMPKGTIVAPEFEVQAGNKGKRVYKRVEPRHQKSTRELGLYHNSGIKEFNCSDKSTCLAGSKAPVE